jgi:hypothetical protein
LRTVSSRVKLKLKILFLPDENLPQRVSVIYMVDVHMFISLNNEFFLQLGLCQVAETCIHEEEEEEANGLLASKLTRSHA